MKLPTFVLQVNAYIKCGATEYSNLTILGNAIKMVMSFVITCKSNTSDKMES